MLVLDSIVFYPFVEYTVLLHQCKWYKAKFNNIIPRLKTILILIAQKNCQALARVCFLFLFFSSFCELFVEMADEVPSSGNEYVDVVNKRIRNYLKKLVCISVLSLLLFW